MAEPLRRLFTRSEYHTMLEAGILHEDDRVELIEGEIWEMSPIGSKHAACVDRLNMALAASLQGRAIVRVQSPIGLNDLSEPQPDLSVLRFRSDFYTKDHPTPGDVVLLIEVADTTLAKDRGKIELCARHGIPEAWLVNLQDDILEIHRRPTSQGYTAIRKLQRGKTVSPQAFPHLEIKVDDILD
ncbi:MAG TPA: Uma2 family endonuclease [Thermoanaerobaculia bacterium]|nr:Uma2 family endonuclease [Thermoanaerobaculia bacterium]